MKLSFRVDLKKIVAQMNAGRDKIKASSFKPELDWFMGKALAEAVRITPRRSAAVIATSQRRQYKMRINYIPSVHELIDPSLIINEEGEQWLWSGGKWYLVDGRYLPDDVFGNYAMLLDERERRLRTTQGDFVRERKQANQLYARSWLEVAESLNIPITVAAGVKSSHSRRTRSQLRRGYKQHPQRAFGQKHGGKEVLSYSIQNRFLDAPSRYKKFTAYDIISKAEAKFHAQFMKRVAVKAGKLIREALKTAR